MSSTRSQWVPVAAAIIGLPWHIAGASEVKTIEVKTIASLENRTVDVQPGKEIAESSDKARENYRQFLKLVSDDPRLRAEAMRRLADLELESAQAAQTDGNGGASNAAGYENAVSLFRELLESYPDYRRNDTVLYQLARAYEISGKTDDALRVLNELVARFPDTRRLDEVQFRRGEMLFLRRDYAASEKAYRQVVNYGATSRFYEQSLYKLGWSLFKLGRNEESLDPFFDLLDLELANVELQDGDNRLEALGRADRELVDDTFRVLSVGFSYMDGANSIVDYLDKRGYPDYAWVIFMNLGDLYLEKERYVDAAKAYETFVQRDPLHSESPLLQIEAIEAYKRGQFPDLVLEGKKGFVERYGMDSPYWDRNPPERNTAVVAHLKENLIDLAKFYHAAAQSSGKAKDYEAAARWYRKYLDFFPDEPDSAATNFLLAEILFESGDFEAATAEYERTAYDYPRHAHSGEAAYAAILSYLKYEDELQGADKIAWHRKYLDSALRFADAYPEHPESGAVLTAVAEDLFKQKQFDLATTVGQAVVDKEPPVSDPLARTAWTVIAHSQFELEHFAGAEAAYYRLRPLIPADDREDDRADDSEDNGEDNGESVRNVNERIASSIYKQGEAARDRGDLEGAVQHFLRVGQAVPDSPVRETAEYDAAAALINLQAWDRAVPLLEAFRRDFPGSKFSDEVSQKLAVSYLEAGRGTAAANEFERIADAAANAEPVRRAALWKAAELYKTGGQPEQETEVLRKIVERYPHPVAESIEARFRLLELAEAGGDSKARTALLHDIVRADASAGAERSDRTRYLAAKASLELAEPARRRFMAIRITQPIAESLKLKKERMEEVLTAYGKAAEYGVAEVTTAATYRLGEVYRQFSRDLMKSERPADLDAAALEQYEVLLEEQAFPFEEKAIDLFQVNTALAADGLYDEWVRKSFAALAELVPARYAKSERSEDVVTTLY